MGVTAFSDRNKMTNVWQKAVGVVDFENCPFQGLHLNLFNTDIPSSCHDVSLTQRIAMMAPAIGVQAFLTDAKTLDMHSDTVNSLNGVQCHLFLGDSSTPFWVCLIAQPQNHQAIA